MMKARAPFLRGLTAQLFAITVLPLTLLLLLIAFGSVYLHEQNMRALVSERDERAVQSAAAALDSELHHRMANISSMAIYYASAGDLAFEKIFTDSTVRAADFDGGMAFLDSSGRPIAKTGNDPLWMWIARNTRSLRLASSTDAGPVISDPFVDPNSGRTFILISAYSPSNNAIAAGALTPESLAAPILSASYPAGSQVTVYLVDSSRRVLFVSGATETQTASPDHPGVAEGLLGQSGARYVQLGNSEHVIAYSPIRPTGWVLVTEEAWEAVISPSLQVTQVAPLVLVPAFILALIALWFAARRIVQPLQRLESKAAALAWGNFDAIKEDVGGISEVQHLQMELTDMARKVQAAQEGLHDYIGAITAAQEEERTRLARELHDDTIQAVIALKQRVQLAHKSVKTESGQEALRELETLAEETIENLRRLTRALRPIYLEDLGLVTALEVLARETSQVDHLHVEFQLSGEERRLSREVELALYRIAQEGLSNVTHHSKARHATLRIVFDKEIKLEVSDNGVGFTVPKSPTEFAPSGHFGLLGMRERADLIGGRLEVQSEAGKGTRLSVRLAASSSHPKRKKRDERS